MANPKLDFTNVSFYSEGVSIEIDPGFINKLPNKKFALKEYREQMLKHLEEVDKVISDAAHDGLESMYLSFSHEHQMPAKEFSALSGEKLLRLHLVGVKPWSPEKIEELNQAMNQEKDEISQLKELIKKYPEKALLICNTLK